jgi:hypothetical protein
MTEPEICNGCWMWMRGAQGLGLCRRMNKETIWNGSCKLWTPKEP